MILQIYHNNYQKASAVFVDGLFASQCKNPIANFILLQEI